MSIESMPSPNGMGVAKALVESSKSGDAIAAQRGGSAEDSPEILR